MLEACSKLPPNFWLQSIILGWLTTSNAFLKEGPSPCDSYQPHPFRFCLVLFLSILHTYMFYMTYIMHHYVKLYYTIRESSIPKWLMSQAFSSVFANAEKEQPLWAILAYLQMPLFQPGEVGRFRMVCRAFSFPTAYDLLPESQKR